MRLKSVCTLIRNFNREAGRKCLLVLDNIDYIYHLNDRVIFTPSADIIDHQAIACVRELVTGFIHDGDHRDLGELGINVLFSLRPDSYEILQESAGLFRSERAFDYNKRVVTLTQPNWRDVVKARGALVDFALSLIPEEGRRRAHASIVDPILADLEYKPAGGQKRLIEHLEKLSNYGLRDIMEFFAQYSWLEGQSFGGQGEAAGLSRLMHSYPVGLHAYMLGGRCRFNQFKSRFPNIYLVSLQEDLSDENRGTVLDRRHPHTYWLKRLILTFIEAAEARGEAIRAGDILEAFGGAGGYDEQLVRLCLGSLTQVDVSNLIRIAKTKAAGTNCLQISDIQLTERGRHCLREVFDQFFYLQLIVDDYQLPLPRSLHDIFAFSDRVPDYSYIGSPPGEYGEKAAEMVRVKAMQVLLFVELLLAALDYEREQYHGCFERLSRCGGALPAVQSLRVSIQSQLRSIATVHPGMDLNLKQMLSDVGMRLPQIRMAVRLAYQAHSGT